MPDIGISNIVPLAFGEVYEWGPSSQGLSNAGFLVGCFIGEAFAGKVSDIVSFRVLEPGYFAHRKRSISAGV